jgi:hypothetical protein
MARWHTGSFMYDGIKPNHGRSCIRNQVLNCRIINQLSIHCVRSDERNEKWTEKSCFFWLQEFCLDFDKIAN